MTPHALPAAGFTGDMLIACLVLVAAYVLIFTEKIHRTSAAIIGAVSMIGIGMWQGFYSQEAAILAVDANTIFLLAAMMMLVAMLRPTGAFEYTAIILTRLSKGQPARLLVLLSLAVSLISMVLDNVTTVIVFAPLTVLITRILQLNPLPFLMAEAMLSNVGGIATLVGDPPNIMIGSAAGIDFTTFLVHMGPPVTVVWLATVGIMLFMFRHQLEPGQITSKDIHLDLEKSIKDRAALIKIMAALGLTVVLFFLHHRFHLFPAYAAFIGLALALALLQPKPDNLFGEINWSVLVFFVGLFIIVGGVESTGLLHLLGERLAHFAQEPGMLLITCLLLMWVAALISALVDNIPFTVTMIPIIASLEFNGVNISPLWWALALGVGLGGNGTHIGATANLIAVAESEKSGIPEARITPAHWIRVGAPTTLLSLVVASVVYTLLFDYLAG